MSSSAIIDRLQSGLADRYRVERELGEGGMATVFLMEDLKHERKVALKVLKPALAAVVGAERFLKEIQVTAKLQHPNILPLFDSGEVDGLLYYVMPYVEGESLRQRLDRERELPVSTAVAVAREVAGALDYAHRQRVIHRDIKPGNILLQEGRAMVADFGIALAVQVAGGERVTEEGLYVGTAEYMSPEQASGDRLVDARSDVYSLGAVLYEMLAGEPPHTGSTTRAVLTKVLTEQPKPLADIRSTVPHPVMAVVERALAPLPADRFQSAAELAGALEAAAPERPGAAGQPAKPRRRGGPQVAAPGPQPMRWWPAALVGLGLLLAGVVLGRLLGTPPAPSAEAPTRFTVDLPAGWAVAPEDLRATTITRDGRRIAVVASDGQVKRIFLRDLAEREAKPVPGTEGAMGPFFSPDGDWLGFFADGRLKKIALSGGPPVTLADAALARGAAWSPDGTVLFTSAPGTGLWRVPATGGRQELVTSLDLEADERTHRLPTFASADAVYFTIRKGTQATFAEGEVALLSMETGEHEVVLDGGTHPVPLPTGHLLFARGVVLQAVELGDDGRPRGDPVALVEDVMYDPSTGASQYDVSTSGTLVYLEGGEWAARRVVHLRGGSADRVVVDDTGAYRSPRIAPDGRRVALVVEGANDDIWIHDLQTATARRLTFAGGSNIAPVWSPDGKTLVFASNRQGRYNLYRKDVSGGAVSRVAVSEAIQFPSSWHPSGDVVAYTEVGEGTGSDIHVVAVDGDGDPEVFTAEPHNEYGPAFSPDGRWLAYTSDESGRDEIYLQRYPATGEKEQVSMDGGTQPRWSPDGRTLYYRQGTRIVAVEIRTDPTVAVAAPRTLLEGDFAIGSINSVHPYDVHPDGEGLLVAGVDRSRPPERIHVVLDWFTELRSRLAR